MYRRIAINAVINLVNLGANILLGLLMTPYFIRVLGQDTYGVWVFAVSLSVMRGFLGNVDFGIQTAVVKFVAEYEAIKEYEAINELVSAALASFTVVGLAIAMGIFSLAVFGMGLVVSVFRIPDAQIGVARILLIYLGLQTLFDYPALTAMALLEGLQRYDVTRSLNILRLLVFAVLSVLFIKLGMNVYALAVATFAGEVARLLGHIGAIRRIFPPFRLTPKVTSRTLNRIFGFAGRAFIFSVMNAVNTQMDIVIISVMLSTTFLTHYDISNRLHLLVFALTTILSPFVVPAASALYARDDRPGLRRLLVRATRYSAMLMLPVAAITMLFAKPLTGSWIGQEYIHTASTTQLFISYLLFWVLVRIGQNMLIAVNRVETAYPLLVVMLVVHAVISIAMAPLMGVFGVILGMVIGNGLVFVPYLVVFRREFGLTWRDWWRDVFLRVYPQAVVGTMAVAGLCLWHAPVTLIEISAYAVVGVGLSGILFLLTGIPPDERMALLGQIRGMAEKFGWMSSV